MSLESILEHILNESKIQREKILEDARLEAGKVILQARQEAEALYKDIFEKEKAGYERHRHRLLVNARLEHKKGLLLAKQELIDAVFKKLKSTLRQESFKKEQVLADKVKEVPEDIDFYLSRFRHDHEAEVAKILF